MGSGSTSGDLGYLAQWGSQLPQGLLVTSTHTAPAPWPHTVSPPGGGSYRACLSLWLGFCLQMVTHTLGKRDQRKEERGTVGSFLSRTCQHSWDTRVHKIDPRSQVQSRGREGRYLGEPLSLLGLSPWLHPQGPEQTLTFPHTHRQEPGTGHTLPFLWVQRWLLASLLWPGAWTIHPSPWGSQSHRVPTLQRDSRCPERLTMLGWLPPLSAARASPLGAPTLRSADCGLFMPVSPALWT